MTFTIFFLVFSLVAAAADCEISYDEQGIPHAETTTLEDKFYCMGLLHGRDRAWMMDFLRRLAQGRNAEVFGFSHLKSDLMMRLLDLPGRAQRLWEEFPQEGRASLVAYAAGVNAGFAEGKRTKEFSDLGYEPEPWTPVNTLTVLLTQSFDQTRKTFYRDYQEELSKDVWKEKADRLFDQDGLPWNSTILKKGEYIKGDIFGQSTTSVPVPAKLWAPFPTVFGEASGSNNWVIGKKKSKTGYAILANDPHLDLKTPLFWYWLRLTWKDGSVLGASLPGVPVIAAGTNGKVAWGLTNSYINTADAVLVKDPPTESVRPFVWVKWGFLKLPFFFKSFERTRRGQPILPLEIERDEKMLLKWTGFALSPKEIAPMLAIDTAASSAEMERALRGVGVPAWNFVFADRKGVIGYRMVGKTFRHLEKPPLGLQTLTLKEFEKEDFLEAHEIPHVLAPARDYVVTANNRHWPEDAAFHGGYGYTPSFRALRIERLLQEKHDVESFKRMQCDRYVIEAEFMRPKLLKHLKLPVLENWDLYAGVDSKGIGLYRRLVDLLMERWKLTEGALYRYLGELPPEKITELRTIAAEAEADVKGRTWGELLKVSFPHLSNDGRWVFSPELPGLGDTSTVDPGTSRWNPERKLYEHFSGASMRMIIEMRNPPRVLLVLPGQNRQYAEKSSKTPWQDWQACRYSELSF